MIWSRAKNAERYRSFYWNVLNVLMNAICVEECISFCHSMLDCISSFCFVQNFSILTHFSRKSHHIKTRTIGFIVCLCVFVWLVDVWRNLFFEIHWNKVYIFREMLCYWRYNIWSQWQWRCNFVTGWCWWFIRECMHAIGFHWRRHYPQICKICKTLRLWLL